MNFETAFFVPAKNGASPNFSQPELARLPNFCILGSQVKISQR